MTALPRAGDLPSIEVNRVNSESCLADVAAPSGTVTVNVSAVMVTTGKSWKLMVNVL